MEINQKDMTDEEENVIWRDYKDNNNKKSKDFLICKYIPLVKYVVGKVYPNIPRNVEFEDCISYGTIGLIDAVTKFDPSRGNKFKTYAIQRIRGQIFDELRMLDWVPRSVRQKHKIMEEMRQKYKEATGEVMTNEQVSEKMGISLSEVNRISNMSNDSNITSLDHIWSSQKDDDEIVVMDTLKSNSSVDPVVELEKQQIVDTIVQELKKLPKKEQDVLVLYYFEELTLKEIGEALSVTESRVSQLHSKAIRSLKSQVDEVKKSFV